MFKTWSSWDKHGILDNKTKKDNTVEPRFADIPLLRTVFFVPGESPYIFSKFNLLNTDTNFLPNQ